MTDIRVRIAPSPTGLFHIGNAKTALVNWLFARQSGGTFILRVEDTDVERSRDEYTRVIFDALNWLGIDWDEGPLPEGSEKGAYGPYRQSHRKQLHRDEAHRLIAEDKAFRCFCTREELEAEREKARAEKRTPKYSGKCRDLTAEEIAVKGDEPYAIRFKLPQGFTEVDDQLQGVVRTNNAEFDDFVIVKPNGDPVFHLAVVVDDGMMEVSHVIRGDDHLTNAARHVMLFKALGYPVPKFLHLPMVLDEKGAKYSKRLHGANLLDWRADGYLPETMINYLVLLGWNPGDDREVFTRNELLRAFSLERLGKSAAKFDMKKLQWLNGQHIRKLSAEDLRDRLAPILNERGLDTSTKSDEWLTKLAEICRDKLRTLNDVVIQADFFFQEPTQYEEKAVKKQWETEGALELLTALRETMANVDEWSKEALHHAFEQLGGERDLGLGKLIHPTRLALTGKSVGPGLFELAELLGKDKALDRMDRAIEYVESLEAAQR